MSIKDEKGLTGVDIAISLIIITIFIAMIANPLVRFLENKIKIMRKTLYLGDLYQLVYYTVLEQWLL